MALDHLDIDTTPALDRPDLLAEPVREALVAFARAEEVRVFEIDPDLADTQALSDALGLPLESGVNCVLVGGKRDGEQRVAACLVRADTRVDVNNVVKRTLDVRKASFLPHEQAVTESGMEYGGITPIGLPDTWRLLVDSRCAEVEEAVIGSGVRRSKLLVAGHLLAALPRAEVIDGLAG